MREFRKDYFLDRWTAFSTERRKRPHEYLGKRKEAAKAKATAASERETLPERDEKCPFCPGNEKMTPPEITRVGAEGTTGGRGDSGKGAQGAGGGKGGWSIRVFPNKYTVASREEKGKGHKEGFLHAVPGYGFHEVVVETPRHDLQMADLGGEQIAKVFEVCAGRVREMDADARVKHVSLFKNKGERGGCSLVHSHMQIVGMPAGGIEVNDLVLAEEKFRREHKVKCGFCELAEVEGSGERGIMENKGFVAFAPFAARFAYEAMVVPKRHVKSIVDLNGKEFLGLAEVVKKLLGKIALLGADYNMYFHNSPEGKDLHFHAHLCPRLAKWAGFEFESGNRINSYAPEDCAKFYRE